MSSLTFSTLNVRGILDHTKRNKYIAWLKHQNIDIAFLQETYCTSNHVDNIIKSCNNFGYKSFHAITDSNHSRGVSILISNKLDFNVHSTQDDNNGRILLVNIDIEGVKFTLTNIYAPNKVNERIVFFQNLSDFLEQYKLDESETVLGGDFNCTLRNEDRESNRVYHDNSVDVLTNVIINNFSLYDVWQKNHNGKKGFTFYDKNGSKSRLDYFLVNTNPRFIIKKSYIMQTLKADHRCVLLNIKLLKNQRGKGYWKFNNSLLEDEDFCDKIKECVLYVKNQFSHVQSKRVFWEIMKHYLKKTSIGHSIQLSKTRKREKHVLQTEIDQLNSAIEACDNLEVKEKLRQVKAFKEQILNRLYDNYVQGFFIRSRAEYMEKGERSTRYFLTLEKARQNNNVIRCLESDKGNLYKDLDILNEASSFYKKLYSNDNVDIDDIDRFFNNIDIGNKLSKKDKEFCDGVISIKELREAVHNLKLNKSPGSDGLTSDFYKKFWPELEDIFYELSLEIFQKGELSDSMKKGILSLLFKKGDRKLIENYRPLSLGNYDYKILAYIIANRIQKVINKLVNQDQSAYIGGRFIGNNARFLVDLIEWAETQKKRGMIICIDFRKAFDSLNWDFMFATLRNFGFGSNFINMIKTIYNGPTLTIKNNGHFSEELQLQKGIRQGCPASALLFTLCVEILWKAINQNKEVKGINIDEHEVKMVQHADDTSLTLNGEDSLLHALNTIQQFSDVSGLKLHLGKTAGILLGESKDSAEKIHGVSFTNEPIKCLGIYIGHNKTDCENLNWKPKIEDTQKLFESWKKRKLTLFGKVQVINALVVSKFVYNFTILDVPDWVVTDLKKSIFDFLWKKDFIKRTVLYAKIKDGGLNIVDVNTKIESLKASWVSRIVNGNTSGSFIPIYYIKQMGFECNNFIKANSVESKDIFKYSTFYKNVFQFYFAAKDNPMMNLGIFAELVWLNKLFKWKNSVIFYENWLKAGFAYVKDFYNENGEFITEKSVYEKLKNKRNWIHEYYVIRTVLQNSLKNIDKKYANYTLIKNRNFIIVNGKHFNILGLKAKFFYEVLIKKKTTRANSEKKWCEEFCLPYFTSLFNKIYEQKIIKMPCKTLAEFNFKLTHNILFTGYMVNKWNHKVSKTCVVCKSNHTVKHLLYDCEKINNIWKKVSTILNVNIKWKILVIGLMEISKRNSMYNVVLTIICKAIFEQWAKNSEEDEKLKNINYLHGIVIRLNVYRKLFYEINMYNMSKEVKNITDKLVLDIVI